MDKKQRRSGELVKPSVSSLSPEQQARREADERRRLFVKDLIRILTIAAFFVVAGLVLKWQMPPMDKDAGWEDLGDYVRALLHPDSSLTDQVLSYLWFVAGAALLVGVGLPRWIICVAGGMVYGALLGTALSTLGSIGGASLTYLAGSSLLKSTLRRRFHGRFETMRQHFKENGFEYTLHLRLFPGTPAMLTSLAAGACRVRFVDYTAANLIGFLPQTVIFCLLASGAIKTNPNQLLVGILLYVLFMVIHRAIRRKLKRKRARLEAKANQN